MFVLVFGGQLEYFLLFIDLQLLVYFFSRYFEHLNLVNQMQNLIFVFFINCF
jgi:hypothetical protein